MPALHSPPWQLPSTRRPQHISLVCRSVLTALIMIYDCFSRDYPVLKARRPLRSGMPQSLSQLKLLWGEIWPVRTWREILESRFTWTLTYSWHHCSFSMFSVHLKLLLKKVKDLHTAWKSQLSRTLLDPRRPSKIHAMLITDKWHIYLPIWVFFTFPESSFKQSSLNSLE